LSFRIENTGGSSLKITAQSLPRGAPFSAVTNLLAGTVIAANTSLDETVRFTPAIPGGASDAWVIVSDDGQGPHTVTLTGTGSADPPGAPTILSTAAGDAEATVTWSAPVAMGGVVSGYRVAALDLTDAARGGQTCTTSGASATQCVLTGLTNGDQYTFAVVAMDAAGVGATSTASAVVTPRTATGSTLSILTRRGRVGAPLALATSSDPSGGATRFFVVDGSATGCRVHAGELTARSAGTCVVVASRAAHGGYRAITSPARIIVMTGGRVAGTVVSPRVVFAPHAATPSPVLAALLSGWARLLPAGASVRIVGYADHDASLARSRARSVAALLTGATRVRVSIAVVTTSPLNVAEVTVGS
jgi:hypothetical protein